MPTELKNALIVVNSFMKVLKQGCREKIDNPATLEGHTGKPFNGYEKSRSVMPSMDPGQKRAYDAAMSTLKTWDESQREKAATNANQNLEIINEMTPEELAAVAEKPGAAIEYINKRNKRAADSRTGESQALTGSG